MGAPDGSRTQILVRFGYDGARFHGLQPQAPGIATAGGVLRDRLTQAGGSPPKMLHFAARTDAGVHALSNAATCYFRDLADPAAVISRIAAERDDGLVDVRAYQVPVWVHARGSSRGKRYRYRVQGAAALPTTRESAAADRWRVAPPLHVARMEAAAQLLQGTHDFTSLKSPRCTAPDPNKTVSRLTIAVEPDGAIVIEVVGDAFLRQMVRNIAGLLVEIGSGWRPADDVGRVLAARDRKAAGLCAPPEGLTLIEVGFAWPEDGSALLPELASGVASLSAVPAPGAVNAKAT